MGLAASQARFLGLTARMSNTEYTGQQINQQRTALASQSAGAFNEMLTLKVPNPPDVNSYYNINFTFSDPVTSQPKQVVTYTVLASPDPDAGKYKLAYSDGTFGLADAVTTVSGILHSITFNGYSPVTVAQKNVMDDPGYAAAMATYDNQKALYDKAVADINAKTEVLQQQDKTLELKLRQLDTDNKALSTEMDAVKKVIDKNIEMTFKTFA
jgi:hypothetical protein